MKDGERVIYAAVMLLVTTIVLGCESSASHADKTTVSATPESQAPAHPDMALPRPVEDNATSTSRDGVPTVQISRYYPGNRAVDRLPTFSIRTEEVPAEILSSVPKKSTIRLSGIYGDAPSLSSLPLFRVELYQDGESVTVDSDLIQKHHAYLAYHDFIRIWYAIHLNPPAATTADQGASVQMQYETADGKQIHKNMQIQRVEYIFGLIRPSGIERIIGSNCIYSEFDPAYKAEMERNRTLRQEVKERWLSWVFLNGAISVMPIFGGW